MSNSAKQDIEIHSSDTQPAGCSSCSAKEGCGLGFFATLFPRSHVKPEGQIPEGEFIRKVFMLYLMPLIGIIVASSLAGWLYPDDTLIAMLFALIGFAVVVALLYNYYSGHSTK